MQRNPSEGAPPQRRELKPEPEDLLVGGLIDKGVKVGPDGQTQTLQKKDLGQS